MESGFPVQWQASLPNLVCLLNFKGGVKESPVTYNRNSSSNMRVRLLHFLQDATKSEVVMAGAVLQVSELLLEMQMFMRETTITTTFSIVALRP